MLAKAEIAIDAQSAFIRTLQQQIEELTRAIEGGGLGGVGGMAIQGGGVGAGSMQGGEQIIQIFGYADDGTPLGEDGAPLPPDVIALIQQQQQMLENGGMLEGQLSVALQDGTVFPGGPDAMAITQINAGSANGAAGAGDQSMLMMAAAGETTGPDGMPATGDGSNGVGSADGAASHDDPALSMLAGSPGAAVPPQQPGTAPGSPAAATAPGGGNAITAQQILELVSLREEVLILRRQRDLDTDELNARAEEIRALTDAVAAREAEIERIASEKEQAVAQSLEQGRASAVNETMTALKSFGCKICARKPYEELSDIVGGVGALHEQQCFSLQEMSASLSRVEERAAVLQGEVDDLKGLVATANAKQLEMSSQLEAAQKQLQQQAGGAAAKLSSEASSSAASSSLPPPIAGKQREVVDVAVMQDLQQKLTALIMVHRQLLRKYAVVDVECGEMAEGLKARDMRIAELTRASLAHNASIAALKDGYEQRINELLVKHAQSLNDLRREMMVLQRHPHVHTTGGAAAGERSISSSSVNGGSGSASVRLGSSGGLDSSSGYGSGSISPNSATGGGSVAAAALAPHLAASALLDHSSNFSSSSSSTSSVFSDGAATTMMVGPKQPRNVVKPIKGAGSGHHGGVGPHSPS
jgi:hypothetical protein